jgi:predicted MFS family arabinose efflux permease
VTTARDDRPGTVGPALSTDLTSAAPLWAPLRAPAFRAFWVSILVVNVGTWMHTVGAQWMLVDRPGAETLVALVQTSTMLPMLLVSIPAGALADSIDRRRLLMTTAAALCATGIVLTSLAALGSLPSALLLALTFLLGTGAAVAVPTWQAVVPQLLPRDHLAVAAALGSINFNAARVLGPAAAGVLLAFGSVTAVFAVNTVAMAFFLVVTWRWRPPPVARRPAREPLIASIRAGWRHVMRDVVLRRLLLRVVLFGTPASALWALLPVLAARGLDLGAGGYGVMLSALGGGAIAGGLLLPPLRNRISSNALMTAAAAVYAAACLIAAVVTFPVVVTVVLVSAGAAWVAALSTLNAMMQVYLPDAVRGRGMAIYLLVNSGTQAAAAAAWGLAAQYSSAMSALTASAVALLLGAATIRWWPLVRTPEAASR